MSRDGFAPGGGGGYTEHDDEGIEEALKERGHQEIGDDQGQQEIPAEGD